MAAEVGRGDDHGSRIERNRIGILKGAERKREAGAIDADAEREIVKVARRARLSDFRPLLYVIPYGLVRRYVRRVPVEERASPLSEEYVIEALPRRCFDVIEFPTE